LEKETEMTNVATFKSSRNSSTALVTIEGMTAREVLLMHTKIKKGGRGAVTAFIENETSYDGYPQYYYQLKKKGVAPIKPRGTKVQELTYVENLEDRIKKLEMEIHAVRVTPSQRALNILSSHMNEIGHRSRVFLCQLISRDTATLTAKQDKWLSDLEARFL